VLKFLFGRTWPLGLFRRHVYGFFPFHTGPQYASFPSGHTAAVCAVLSILWIWYPRFRPAYVAGASPLARRQASEGEGAVAGLLELSGAMLERLNRHSRKKALRRAAISSGVAASCTFWPSVRTPMTTSSKIDVASQSNRTRTAVPSRTRRTIGSSARERTCRAAQSLCTFRHKRFTVHAAGEQGGQRRTHAACIGVGHQGAPPVGAKCSAPPLVVVPSACCSRAPDRDLRHRHCHSMTRGTRTPFVYALFRHPKGPADRSYCASSPGGYRRTLR